MNIDQALADAVAHHREGRLAQAQAAYRAILAADPDNAAALINLGAALRGSGAPAEAVAVLARATEIVPDHGGAWLNLGNARADSGDVSGAADAFATAAGLDPANTDILLNWGDALSRLNQDNAAIAIYENGLSYAPDDARLLANLANSLLKTGAAAAAVERLERAYRLWPDDAPIARNLANAYRLAGAPARAAEMLDELLARNPDDADALCLRAFTRFALGEYAAAWPDYRARWRSAHQEAARPFAQSPWRGEDLSGKTILVWGEQAVGDEIMFATMLGEVIGRARRVILETEHRLEPLFRRSFQGAEVIARRDPPQARLMAADIDYQTAMGDLGTWLRTDRGAFPAGGPYLKADPTRTEALRERYRALAEGRPRIGVSWRSGVEHAGAARSLDMDTLASLIGAVDGWWLSLQYGDTSAELAALAAAGARVPHADPMVDPLASLDELAAQMAGLDLVVSVANTTVHLAGALGRPTLALLANVADWRWGGAGEDCLWYPSVTLLRQAEPGAWSSVIERAANLASDLRSY